MANSRIGVGSGDDTLTALDDVDPLVMVDIVGSIHVLLDMIFCVPESPAEDGFLESDVVRDLLAAVKSLYEEEETSRVLQVRDEGGESGGRTSSYSNVRLDITVLPVDSLLADGRGLPGSETALREGSWRFPVRGFQDPPGGTPVRRPRASIKSMAYVIQAPSIGRPLTICSWLLDPPTTSHQTNQEKRAQW